MKQHLTTQRYWELDVWRGSAVVLMVFYHLVFDLSYFVGLPVNFSAWYWLLLARFIQLSFLLLVGISLWLSFTRIRGSLSENQIWLFFIKRGAKIFGAGLVISAFSLYFAPEAPIILGILHFIGLATCLAYPWLKSSRNWWPLIVVLVTLGILFRLIRVSSYTWLVLGLMPETFSSLDYFPLLPWFGVVLAGIEMGKKVYGDKVRQADRLSQPRNVFLKLMSFLGQHALFIYLLHQPLIWISLLLLG